MISTTSLYFVPLKPSVVNECVACQRCGMTFPGQVLAIPTTPALVIHTQVAMRVAVVALLAAGDSSDSSRRLEAIGAVRSTGLNQYDDQFLTQDLGAIDASQLSEYLSPLHELPNPQAARRFATDAAKVAIRGGCPTVAESTILRIITDALELHPECLSDHHSLPPTTPAGWYPDPEGTSTNGWRETAPTRWWDGSICRWTEHTSLAQIPLG